MELVFLRTRTCYLIGMAATLLACAQVAPQLESPSYLNEPDVSKLSEWELLARLQWDATGCIRTLKVKMDAGRLLSAQQTLDDCKRASITDDMRTVGSRVAETHLKWPDALRQNLQKGLPFAVGMTEDQARRLLVLLCGFVR